MSLDLLVLFDNGENKRLVMSEELHSEIFSSTTRWSSCKELRKIHDYYQSDVKFNAKESSAFLSELVNITQHIYRGKEESLRIINILSEQGIQHLRVAGD